MTTYITTKDTAKLIREALKSSFPGVKFSVRCGTGTGSAWIGVSWVDGPLTTSVREICNRYEGRHFNGMTDGYDDMGTALIVRDGAEMPEEVRFCCDGVNESRRISPEMRDLARIYSDSHIVYDGEIEYGTVVNDRIVEARWGRDDNHFEMVAHQFTAEELSASV